MTIPPTRRRFGRGDNPSDNVVQRTRAWTGLWVVAGSDVAIVLAAIWGVVKLSTTPASGQTIVAILTSAFTAIGTMTTAYFGIRSSANAAQAAIPPTNGSAAPTPSAAPQPAAPQATAQ